MVARHLQDDDTELARLRSRFEEAYLLIEVGVEREEVHDQVLNIASFALMSLVDEAELMKVLEGDVQLNIVEREDSTEGCQQ